MGLTGSDALDNPEIPDRTITQRRERHLVGGAFVRRARLLHARELDHHRALEATGLESLRGDAARQDTAALCFKRRSGNLCVGAEPGWVLDLEIRGNPLGFGHAISPARG